MKKIISLIICVILLFTVVTTTASAETIEQGEIVISKIDANPGDSVFVPFEFKENPGIMASTISITYDSSVLEYVNYKKGNILKDYLFAEHPEKNIIRFVSCESTTRRKSGTLFTLEFKVKDKAKDGLSKLDIVYSSGDFCDWQLNRIMPKIVSGGVNVALTQKNCSHKYGDWETVAVASCTQNGVKQHSCSKCGHLENKEISKTGHKYSDAWSVVTPATESSHGTIARVCIYCEEYTDQKAYMLSDVDKGKFENIPDAELPKNDVTEEIFGRDTIKDDNTENKKDTDDILSQLSPDLQSDGDTTVMEKITEAFPLADGLLSFFEKALIFLLILVFI